VIAALDALGANPLLGAAFRERRGIATAGALTGH
jgi:hypothetical protein